MGLPLMWLHGPRAGRVGCRLDGEKNDAIKRPWCQSSWARWLMMMSFAFSLLLNE